MKTTLSKNSISRPSLRLGSVLVALLLACVVFLQRAQAVSPPPDGGYPGGNTAEGQNALQSTTTGGFNAAVGYFSLFANTTGSFNTAVGAGALDLNTANNNTAIGAAALLLNTIGSNNTADGTDALVFNNTGTQNTATGAFALYGNTTGSGNIAVGYQAGSSLTTGNNNIEIGNTGVAAESNTIRIGDPAIHTAMFLAGITAMSPAAPNQAVLVDPATSQLGSADISSFGVVSTSPENTAVGDQALVSNTGESNTATGFRALFSNTSGNQNSANGAHALEHNGDGTQNCAYGTDALAFNGFGVSGAHFNDAFGAFALFNNTDGYTNNALGNHALFANIHGAGNTAVGDLALQNNDLSGLALGNRNTAVGAQALLANVDGEANNAVGYSALLNSTGAANTAVGDFAGRNLTAGSGNVYIGAGVLGQSVESNHTYIRNLTSTSVSGSGTEAVTVNLSTGLLGHVSSSRRYKEDIKPIGDASETLYRLQPVAYRYKKEIDPSQNRDYGLVAEDVAQVDPNLTNRNRDGEVESVRYNAINALLLNEFLNEHRIVQEQGATIACLQKQIEALTAGLQRVNAQLELRKPAAQTVLNAQ